jgi:hypothetical protein
MKVLQSYVTSDGVKLTVYAMAKPRTNERTWHGASKYSVYQLGAQAAKNGRRSVYSTPG